jgi:hypothetical protein
LAEFGAWGRLAFPYQGKISMTNTVAPPQDFAKKCKQAEREHEAKKLEILLERVKKQIERRSDAGRKAESPKPPLIAVPESSRFPARSVVFER